MTGSFMHHQKNNQTRITKSHLDTNRYLRTLHLGTNNLSLLPYFLVVTYSCSSRAFCACNPGLVVSNFLSNLAILLSISFPGVYFDWNCSCFMSPLLVPLKTKQNPMPTHENKIHIFNELLHLSTNKTSL